MTDPHRLDLREIDKADVYIGDDLVAHLVRQRGDNVSFDYLGGGHLTNRRVRDQSVSWSLLRSGEYPVITTGGAVPAFFAGLLPEGVRLGVVTSSTKTSTDDHFTLLLAIGADTIGNVRVFPAGADPIRPLPLFEPERDTDFGAVFARMTGSVEADPVGLAGVQPKVSAGMLSMPTRTRSGPAILKLTPAKYPLLVENEHFFMTMAAACGLRVAKTSVLHDAEGRSALLVTRFDREGTVRIAQEDACQVADVYPRLEVPHQDRDCHHWTCRGVCAGGWFQGGCSRGTAQNRCLFLAYRQRRSARQEPVDLQPEGNMATDSRLRPAVHAALPRLERPNGAQSLRPCRQAEPHRFHRSRRTARAASTRYSQLDRRSCRCRTGLAGTM